MIRTKEDVMAEAIKRMETLNLHENVIADFKQGVLNKSEDIGILYWLTEEEKNLVDKFETDADRLVYHIIHARTEFGELYNVLYVNYDDEEWELENEDLKAKQAISYVINKDTPIFSEFGCIGIEPSIGGLIRTW